jgi:beta-glucosidase
MKGRTYKYFEGEPLYPFGFGLSFTSFDYSNLNVPQNSETDKPLAVSVDVQNTGKEEGDEVIQVYISHKNASVPVPIRSLVAFRRVHLDAGEKMTLEFKISSSQLSVITDKGKRQVEPGSFEITAGGCQSVNPKPVSTGLVSGSFNLTGNIIELKE